MRRPLHLALFVAALSVPGASLSDDALVAAGKQRAEASELSWLVRDGEHQKMGHIRVAIAVDAHTSYIGTAKIISSVYLSCEKGTGKIAIELTNARSIDRTSGLPPKEMPRLACVGAGASPSKSEIPSKWETNELGDVLTRGLSGAVLRRCASIEIAEKIALPAALGRDSQEFSIEIAPYARELDAVFSACGETPVYALAEKPVAAAPPEKPRVAVAAPAEKPTLVAADPKPVTAEAPVAEPGAAAVDTSWKHAHTIGNGRTNIRSSGSTSSRVVAQLPSGVKILVQQGANDWWRVKSPSASATYGGFIRRDRFELD